MYGRRRQKSVMWRSYLLKLCLVLVITCSVVGRVTAQSSDSTRRTKPHDNSTDEIERRKRAFFMQKRDLPGGREQICREFVENLMRLHMLARKIQCPIATSQHEALKGRRQYCRTPFKYATAGGPAMTYYMCKPYEPELDTFVHDGVAPQCIGGGYSCDYWCPLELDEKTGLFDPLHHRWAWCHPGECQGQRTVCLSNRGELCLLPYEYKSFELQDEEPVLHRHCTNADKPNPFDYWCPVAVSRELNPDCVPEHIFYRETCDERFSTCYFENGDDEAKAEAEADEYQAAGVALQDWEKFDFY